MVYFDEQGTGDGEETVTVTSIPGFATAKNLGAALARALGSKAKVNTTPAEGQTSNSQQPNNAGTDEEAARQRVAAFQRMRDSGMFGGFGGGGFGGGNRGGGAPSGAPGGAAPANTGGRGGR